MHRASLFRLPRPVVLGQPQASVAALPLAVLLLTTPATSQIVAGRVVDSDKAPVDGVTIALIDTLAATQREVVTNSAGQFIIVINTPGTYLLQASRLGYATAQTPPIEIADAEVVEVELRLDVEAVELDPLTVVIRRAETQRERELRGYHERIARYGEPQAGLIQIYTRETLADWDALSFEDVFRDYLRWRWRTSGSNCDPKVFLDGRHMYGQFLVDLRYMSISSIEGIELYAGTGPDRSRFWDPNGCGVILVWRRVLPEGGGGLGVIEVLALGGAAVVLVLLAAWSAF